MLKYKLENTGFKDIKRYSAGESNNMVFNNIERHGLVVPAEFNSLTTMALEAIK